MISLQTFNGQMIEKKERLLASYQFMPLFREAVLENKNMGGEIPSSPIPPARRKKSTYDISSSLSDSLPTNLNKNDRMDELTHSGVVWKPYRASSKLNTFELVTS